MKETIVVKTDERLSALYKICCWGCVELRFLSLDSLLTCMVYGTVYLNQQGSLCTMYMCVYRFFFLSEWLLEFKWYVSEKCCHFTLCVCECVTVLFWVTVLVYKVHLLQYYGVSDMHSLNIPTRFWDSYMNFKVTFFKLLSKNHYSSYN